MHYVMLLFMLLIFYGQDSSSYCIREHLLPKMVKFGFHWTALRTSLTRAYVCNAQTQTDTTKNTEENSSYKQDSVIKNTGQS